MAIAVVDDDFRKIEGRHSFETGEVYSELIGVRAALVMRVNSTDRAKMMFRDVRVELIEREIFRTAREFKV